MKCSPTLNGKAVLKIPLIISFSCSGKLSRHNDGHQHAAHSSSQKQQLRCVAILIRGWRILKRLWSGDIPGQAFLLGMPHWGFGHHVVKREFVGVIWGSIAEMTWEQVRKALRLKAEIRKTLHKKSFSKSEREASKSLGW